MGRQRRAGEKEQCPQRQPTRPHLSISRESPISVRHLDLTATTCKPNHAGVVAVVVVVFVFVERDG